MNSNPFLAAYNFPGYIQNNNFRPLYGHTPFAIIKPRLATTESAPVPASIKRERKIQQQKKTTDEMNYCYQQIKELIHPGSNAFMPKHTILKEALEMIKAQKSMLDYLENISRQK